MIFRFLIVLAIIVLGVWAGNYLYKNYIVNSALDIQPIGQSFKKEIKNNMKETVRFKTSDNVEIAGDYYGAKNSRALILIHMMPATRTSYEQFAETAIKNGFDSLAIDLRGHGDSIIQGGKILDYAKFSDSDHQKSILDIGAAVNFLKSKGFIKDKIYLVGASIGANLALEFQAENSAVKKAVLLSPGLDYRGIKTDKFITGLNAGQNVFLIVSNEDSYSFESVERLYNLVPVLVGKEKKIYNNAGHGTNIFAGEKEAINLIIDWLKE